MKLLFSMPIPDIIIVSNSSVFGGAEQFICNFTSLVEIERTIVAAKDKTLKTVLRSSVETIHLSQYALLMICLKAIVARHKFTIILNGISESRRYSWMSLFQNVILISHSLEEWGPKHDKTVHQKLRSCINRIVFSRVKVIVAVCRAAEKNLQANFSSKNIRVIYNTFRGTTTTNAISHGPRVLRIGYIGRLSPEKGVKTFLKAAGMLIDSVPLREKLSITIAGTGPDAPDVERFITDNMSKHDFLNVQYLGFAEKDEFYKNVDVVVIPSKTESNPLVLVESFAHGKVVVASNIQSLSEIITHGQNGYLFSADNANDLYHNLKCLMKKQNKLIICRNAQQTFQKKFSTNIFIAKYGKLIDEVGKM